MRTLNSTTNVNHKANPTDKGLYKPKKVNVYTEKPMDYRRKSDPTKMDK